MVICPIDTDRYGSKQMKEIFDEEVKLQKILDVEASVAQALAEVGEIPQKAAEEIRQKANTKYVKLERCKEIEERIDHDIMAIVKSLSEVCDGEGGRWVHFGLTSNDVYDTATTLQIKEATVIIEEDLISLMKTLMNHSNRYRDLIMAGRTHGQQAGIVTLGFKFAVWLREVSRHLERLREAKRRFLVGKIMGIVGTGAGLGDKAIQIRDTALKQIGLKPADMVTQIIQRDVHAELIAILVNIANSLDKFGTEIRNLQRTEIFEVMEPFKAESQVGSSAMPAKRNPVKSERICSLAKLVRGMIIPAFENVPLWHERDLTNSANERFIIPFTFILLDDMLRTFSKIVKDIVVNSKSMKKNLDLTKGLILSERIAIELVKKGMERQTAHEIVRQCSMKSHMKGVTFKEALLENDEVKSRLTEREITSLLDYTTYLGVTDFLIQDAIRRSQGDLLNSP